MFLIHLLKQINQTHIKIDHTIIRIIRVIRRIIVLPIRHAFSGKKVTHPSRFQIIADEIQYIQVILALIFTQASTKLLQKHRRRFRRAKKHHHVNRWNIDALIEHIHGKNHTNLSDPQLINCNISGFRKRAVRITVYRNRRNPTRTEILRHLLRMLTRTAEP